MGTLYKASTYFRLNRLTKRWSKESYVFFYRFTSSRDCYLLSLRLLVSVIFLLNIQLLYKQFYYFI